MLHISSIHLKKVIGFANTKFPIKPGVSVIYGLNRTNSRKGSNSNAAGKSAFFSQLKETLFEEPVVGNKQDIIKKGERTINAVMGKTKVKITRLNAGLEVTTEDSNGVVEKTKGKSPARQWLNKNLPITEDEFDTYVHLDSRVPHPLVSGKSTERKKFFESFFGLDKLDLERKLFTAEYNKLKTSKSVYAELQKDYESIVCYSKSEMAKKI